MGKYPERGAGVSGAERLAVVLLQAPPPDPDHVRGVLPHALRAGENNLKFSLDNSFLLCSYVVTSPSQGSGS
jgi:hypothetical protein